MLHTILASPPYKFSPRHIPDLQLWLDASRITGLADGDPITTWSDLSGNGNDAAQATAAKKPLYKVNVQNGRPVVRFDGSDDIFDISAAGFVALFDGDDKPFTVVAVFKKATNVGNDWFFTPGHTVSNARQHGLGTEGAVYQSFRRDDASASSNVKDGTADTNWHIGAFTFPGTTISLHVDGAVVINAVAQDVGTFTPNSVGLGANQVGTDNFDGDIAELLTYNRALSATERKRIERHFSSKYNIVVS